MTAITKDRFKQLVNLTLQTHTLTARVGGEGHHSTWSFSDWVLHYASYISTGCKISVPYDDGGSDCDWYYIKQAHARALNKPKTV